MEGTFLMVSGGARARSGPGADPDSYRSQNRDWIDLPASGFAGDIPEFPLPKATHYERYFENGKKVEVRDEDATEIAWDAELELWEELWRKPQAQAWAALGLKFQVAAYVRAFLESVGAEASAGLKTAVLRMENELGLSIMGMKQNLWRLTDGAQPVESPTAARKTSSGDWLKAVTVDRA
jgi:hypothetical protein